MLESAKVQHVVCLSGDAGRGWFNRLLTESGDLPDEAAVAAIAKKAACEQLGISPDLQPSKVNVAYHKVGSERCCFTVL